MRRIVNALLLRDGQILLARRSPQRAAYPALWSFPGGHVERDESLLAALKRELAEEIGIVPGVGRLVATFRDPNAAIDPPTYYLYAVRQWDGTPAIQDHEHSELRWFGLAEAADLPDLALDEYRAVFLALLQSETGGIGPI